VGPQAECLSTGQTRRRQPADGRDDKHDEPKCRRHHCCQQNDEEEERDSEQRIDYAHHQGIEDPTDITGQRSPHEAEQGRYDGHAQPDLECALPSDHEGAQFVSTLGSRAEQVTERRRAVFQKEVRGELIRSVDHRAEEAEQHDHHERDQSDHAHLALRELGGGLAPRRLRIRQVLTTLRACPRTGRLIEVCSGQSA
jgi:hypothetical protein